MPKISKDAGPTDASVPGYFEPGRSHHSPNVHVVQESVEQEAPVEHEDEAERPVPRRRGGRR